jgi:hypothetical protein
MKSIFKSRTFWSAFIGLAGALTPTALQYGETGQIGRKDIVGAGIAIVGAIGVVGGRYAATDTVFTPHGVPGRDKEDIGPDGMLS